MRLAVLNDIHGNLPALEAVLDDVRGAGVERIIVGGDVFPGPAPHLVLRTLAGCGIPVDYLYGNGEIAVLEDLPVLTVRDTVIYPGALLPITVGRPSSLALRALPCASA